MASINITAPDAEMDRIVNGLCGSTGWTVTSGVTKQQWAKQAIVNWMKKVVMGYERQQQAAQISVSEPNIS